MRFILDDRLPKPSENIKTFMRTLSLDWENPPAHVATSASKGVRREKERDREKKEKKEKREKRVR
eukprot:895923-Amorphochlora_amoeboformis.AAC.1